MAAEPCYLCKYIHPYLYKYTHPEHFHNSRDNVVQAVLSLLTTVYNSKLAIDICTCRAGPLHAFAAPVLIISPISERWSNNLNGGFSL